MNIDWSPDETWVLAQTLHAAAASALSDGSRRAGSIEARDRSPNTRSRCGFRTARRLLVVGNEAGKPTRAFQQDVPDGEPKPVLEPVFVPRRLHVTGRRCWRSTANESGDGTR